MSEKKTITINPELFKIPEKQKPGRKPSTEKIKVKPELSSGKSKTLRRNVLKMIRAKQQEEYKEMFSARAPKPPVNDKPIVAEETFQKQFDSSIMYLKNLAEKVENNPEPILPPVHNQTLKIYPTVEPIVHTELPKEFNMPLVNPNAISPSPNEPPIKLNPISSHPGYGCLKGGNYPTYRTWKLNSNNVPVNIQPITTPYSAPDFVMEKPKPIEPEIRKDEVETTEKPKPQSISNILLHQKYKSASPTSASSTSASGDKKPHNYRIRNKRRRKIYKRTYRVGRSNVERKIGCLISNKTIRNKIQQKIHEINHADIKDVRKYLLKRGFIKVGTTAPNDVLRKMYESVASVCGEITNHNKDTLLHNFLNDSDETV